MMFVVGAVFVAVGIFNVDNLPLGASPGIANNFEIQTIGGGSLFVTTQEEDDLGINPVVAQNLLNVLNQVSGNDLTQTRNASHFSTWARGATDTTQDPYLSGAVYLQLFQQIGTPPTGLQLNANPGIGTDLAVSQFTSRLWQVVYMDDGILTLWMVEPYTTHVFGGTHTVAGGGVQYYDSTLRTALVADFDAVLYHFEAASDLVVPMTNVTWQNPENQPNVRGGHAADSSWFNNPQVPDNIWLPSMFEIARTSAQMIDPTPWSILTGPAAPNRLVTNNNRHGLWEVHGFDRGFRNPTWTPAPDPAPINTWLRSGSVQSAGVAAGMWNPGQPSANGEAITNPWSLRPALHIDINKLIAAVTETRAITYVTPQGATDVQEQEVTLGHSATPPNDPTKNGWTFVEWRTGSFTGEPFDFETYIVADIRLYAHFTIDTHTVTFREVLTSEHDNDTTFTINDLPFDLTPADRNGYDFTGWFIDNQGSPVTQIAQLGDVYLYAGWISENIPQVTVTLETPTGDIEVSVTKNGHLNRPTDPVRAGHNFVNWRIETSTGDVFAFDEYYDVSILPVSDDLVLVATFSIITYNITFQNLQGATVTPVTFTIKTATFSLPNPTARTGWTFSGWYVGSTRVTEIVAGSIGSFAVQAVWDEITVVVTFNALGGTAVSSQNVQYSIGRVQPVVSTKYGYNLLGWSTANESQATRPIFNREEVAITTPITLYAVWEEIIDEDVGTTDPDSGPDNYESGDDPNWFRENLYWILIGAGVLLVIGATSVLIVVKRKKKA